MGCFDAGSAQQQQEAALLPPQQAHTPESSCWPFRRSRAVHPLNEAPASCQPAVAGPQLQAATHHLPTLDHALPADTPFPSQPANHHHTPPPGPAQQGIPGPPLHDPPLSEQPRVEYAPPAHRTSHNGAVRASHSRHRPSNTGDNPVADIQAMLRPASARPTSAAPNRPMSARPGMLPVSDRPLVQKAPSRNDRLMLLERNRTSRLQQEEALQSQRAIMRASEDGYGEPQLQPPRDDRLSLNGAARPRTSRMSHTGAFSSPLAPIVEQRGSWRPADMGTPGSRISTPGARLPPLAAMGGSGVRTFGPSASMRGGAGYSSLGGTAPQSSPGAAARGSSLSGAHGHAHGGIHDDTPTRSRVCSDAGIRPSPAQELLAA